MATQDEIRAKDVVPELTDFRDDTDGLFGDGNQSSFFMKALNLAKSILGRIHLLPTTITAFRTSDVIPVDGPSGTAKMDAEKLLEITEQKAVDKLGPSVDKNTIVDYGYVGSSGITILTGKYIYYGDGTMIDDVDARYTDYVEVGKFDKFYATAKAQYSTCGWAIYDSDKNFLVAGGYDTDSPGTSYEAKDEIVDIGSILTTYPSAKYIRFSSIYADLVINKFISYSANEAYGILNQRITHSTITKYGDVNSSNIPILTGKYINRVDGTMVDEVSSYYTDYVPIDASDKFYVTGYAQYNTCGWAVYDSAKTFLASGCYNTDSPGQRYFIRNEIVNVNVILTSYPKAKYIRFSSHLYSLVLDKFYPYSSDDSFEVHEEKIENNTITKYGDIKDSGIPILSGKYVYRVDGTLVDSASSYYTDYVKISSNDKYYITEIARWDTCGWAVYDDFKFFLGAGGYNTGSPNTRYVADNELVDISLILETYPNAKYIRFCSLESSLIVNKFYPFSADEAFENQAQLDTLYGKKWVACGDSFTHGDFTNYSSSDKYLDDGKYAGKYCVYPYIIGNRHNMEVLNIAVNGSTISQNESSTKSSCFTYPSTGKLYTAIPADADIITLWFGINDSFSGVQLGNIDDDSNDTFCGAWNVALDYITQNYPFAKVGIFVSNACRDAVWPAAVENIAKKWGIPYLDIDAGRPLMITASSRNPASATIKNRVNELQRCAINNNHPNPSAHKFQSLFIEEWLKTL